MRASRSKGSFQAKLLPVLHCSDTLPALLCALPVCAADTFQYDLSNAAYPVGCCCWPHCLTPVPVSPQPSLQPADCQMPLCSAHLCTPTCTVGCWAAALLGCRFHLHAAGLLSGAVAAASSQGAAPKERKVTCCLLVTGWHAADAFQPPQQLLVQPPPSG